MQWWSYWGNLVDGLFSWESAWPLVGDTDPSAIGDVSSDMPVMQGAYSHNKGYMIGTLAIPEYGEEHYLACHSFEHSAVQGCGMTYKGL